MNSRSRYILTRFGYSLVSLYAVATILFLLFRLMPGDPSTAVVSPNMGPETRQLLLAQYGLDKPLHVQYALYIKNLLQGDLGVSFSMGQPVAPIVGIKALNTLSLMLTSIVLANIIGPLIGAYLAWNRGSKTDTAGIGALLAVRGAPVFWTGMIAIMVFSFNLEILPTGGMHSASYTTTGLVSRFVSVDFLWHLVLPVAVTTLYWMAIPALTMRNNMIDVLSADFIDLLEAEGIRERDIIYKHAARNSLLPVVHYAAISIAFAFGGSVIIEKVFSWPGIGHLMWQAVQQQDYPLAQGAFLMLAFMVISMNFLADILSVYVDPRAAVDGGVEA